MKFFIHRHSTLFLTMLLVVAAGLPQTLVPQEPEALDMHVETESDWPREILTTKGTIVIFQPQPDDQRFDFLGAMGGNAESYRGSVVHQVNAVFVQGKRVDKFVYDFSHLVETAFKLIDFRHGTGSIAGVIRRVAVILQHGAENFPESPPAVHHICSAH